MKLNWGHYIVIGITAFVILILYMVFRSFQHDHQLVTEDYYEQELEYQTLIEKKQRASELGHEITWLIKDEGLLIRYPDQLEGIEGKLFLYRPSDKELDISMDITPDSLNQQLISMDELVQGKYSLQIDWQHGSSSYFTEGIVFISK